MRVPAALFVGIAAAAVLLTLTTYLRASGRPFTLWSWRLLGILFSATGLIVDRR